MFVRVDVCDGGRYRLYKEVASASLDVVTVAEEMELSKLHRCSYELVTDNVRNPLEFVLLIVSFLPSLSDSRLRKRYGSHPSLPWVGEESRATKIRNQCRGELEWTGFE